MKLKKDNHLRINGEELAAELGYKSTLDMLDALGKMRRMKPAFLKKEKLSDLAEIEIDDSLTQEERALSLLRQTHNPSLKLPAISVFVSVVPSVYRAHIIF